MDVPLVGGTVALSTEVLGAKSTAKVPYAEVIVDVCLLRISKRLKKKQPHVTYVQVAGLTHSGGTVGAFLGRVSDVEGIGYFSTYVRFLAGVRRFVRLEVHLLMKDCVAVWTVAVILLRLGLLSRGRDRRGWSTNSRGTTRASRS